MEFYYNLLGHAGYDLTIRIEISWRHAILASHTPPFQCQEEEEEVQYWQKPNSHHLYLFLILWWDESSTAVMILIS